MSNRSVSDGTTIAKVVAGGYCIGCGSCAVQNARNSVELSPFGLYQAKLDAEASEDEVCPFAAQLSEDDIARPLYADQNRFDERVGFYISNYLGYVVQDSFRNSASSGGIVTWTLAELFCRGEIDGVIHVAEGIDNLFEYRVSESLAEIRSGSKSRYYPVHYDEALRSVLKNGRRYAFVGVPCFVKSIRLLARVNDDVATSIKFCISIFCGHLKTKAFSEMIAMQQGVAPDAVASLDFRVKDLNRPANQYSTQVFTKDDHGAKYPLTAVPTRELYGLDWGLGYFRPTACDWCDDIAGEVADLSCGDAWLPETVSDSKGTNIVISRNRIIEELLQYGMSNGLISLSCIPVDKVYESQAGNYRHRREGLSVRIGDAELSDDWVPKKRVAVADYEVDKVRRRIYRLRNRISRRSHTAFVEARSSGCFMCFVIRMLPLELYYYFLNGRLVRGGAKIAYQCYKYLSRRLRW